ncbi:unnamed protein product [Hymenolepis diminuta]|uniref:Uncharacterized protein n=1 Tax=Hymenolepis diminuta TaxID=6216 RepID=A0A564XW92_HYMDI|nr:unnamed protein product [Hymenolepis diminuta]
MHVWNHAPNGPLAGGVKRAWQGIMLNEFDFDGRTWVRLRNRFRSRYTTKSPQLETVPLDIVLDVSDLPPFGNNEIPHIRPSNQQNLHCEHSRKSPKKFRACPTFKSYNENVLQEELDKSPGQPAASQPASKKALETHFRPTKPSYRIAEWLDGQFICRWP